MSTRYFILQKPVGVPTRDESKNTILVTAPAINYILPQNILPYYAEHGLFENNLIEWCKQYGGSDKVFLDIGAHTGTYALSLAPHFKQVHAFEPQKMTFYALCGSVALSGFKNIDCHNIGLGDETQVGVRELNIVSNDGGGSSIHTNGQAILAKESIVIRTLDSLGLDSIGFIKMDVEENELFVLKGGIETLKRCGYPRIVFESNFNNGPLFNFIREIGYSVIGIGGTKNMFLAYKDN